MVLIIFVVLAAVLVYAVSRSGLTRQESRSLRYWPIAKSETWEGTPYPRARYMATSGLSEWSTGLQLSGFRGAAELELAEGTPSGVSRFIRVTALKARVTGVVQEDETVVVRVRPESRGYEVVAVDLSGYEPGTRLTFVFQDPFGTEVARDTVVIE